jgi:aryl-alcohol dehydrogenase-like predicted oxidoreductase
VLIAGLDAGVTLIGTGDFYGTGQNVIALVGARRRERLHEALGASGLELSPADLERIEATVPAGAAAGSRYAGFLMGELDSERSAA